MPIEKLIIQQIESQLNKKKFQFALQSLSRISNQHSHSATYFHLLARTLRGLGDTRALIKTLTEYNKSYPQLDIEIELMALLYKNGQINQSLDIGLKLLDQNLHIQQKKEVYRILLKIYIEENDFDGVQEVIDQNQDELKLNDFFLWAQGLIYLSRQDINKALKYFRKAIELNHENDQAWVSLAMIHHEMADQELALANLEKALDCNPLNSTAIKLYSNWVSLKTETRFRALSSIQFYLSHYEFDEEISLCHIDLLSRLDKWNEVQFEINKLILVHPANLKYVKIKNNLVQNLNL